MSQKELKEWLEQYAQKIEEQIERPLHMRIGTYKGEYHQGNGDFVTILILVETPLQFCRLFDIARLHKRHNPYFSGNSFAIRNWTGDYIADNGVTILILVETPLQ